MFVGEPNETNSLALPDRLLIFVVTAAVWSSGKSWVDLKSVKLLPLHKSPNSTRNAMTQKSATEPFFRSLGSSIFKLLFLIHSFLEGKKNHPQMNKLSSQTAAHWGTEVPAACQCRYSLVKTKVYNFSIVLVALLLQNTQICACVSVLWVLGFRGEGKNLAGEFCMGFS